ncbi:hypothetical protein LTR17_011885 [Elasticomyces elasticus]|nr:hypothetical protein LTR17_011885 [Elasticomyces elasticus]
MSQRYILYGPAIFPEPKRWLAGDRSLDKWFVVFARGARRCIGQHLAWAEIYLALASIIHRFDLDLYDTDRRDVDPKYDYFVPFPATDRGVRVMLK